MCLVPGGECLVPGGVVSAPGGVCSGVSAPGGVSDPGGGVCSRGWYPSMHLGRPPRGRQLLLQTVRILLECILVNRYRRIRLHLITCQKEKLNIVRFGSGYAPHAIFLFSAVWGWKKMAHVDESTVANIPASFYGSGQQLGKIL